MINASGKEEPGSELSELEAEVASRMKETTTGSDGGCDVEGKREIYYTGKLFLLYFCWFSTNTCSGLICVTLIAVCRLY